MKNKRSTPLCEFKEIFSEFDFNFEKFIEICPFTIPEMKKNTRKHEIVVWRSLASMWIALDKKCKYRLDDIGATRYTVLHFSRTVVPCLKNEIKHPYAVELKNCISKLKTDSFLEDNYYHSHSPIINALSMMEAQIFKTIKS
jgi:hypothetical protein